MICFPLDNTEYQANALGAWCGTRTRGVFAADGHFSVTPSGGMSVTVSPGLGWLKADTYWGVNVYEVNPTVLTIDTADGSLPRIDAVCIRLDKNLGAGSIIIKKGAYSPQPPAITPPVRDVNYDEIYVATITVWAGATSINLSDIADQRTDEMFCGVMRDGVTGIPTQDLYNQWRAKYDQFVSDSHTALNSYQTEFVQWFDTVKGILGEDEAGNLLLLIQSLQADMVLRPKFSDFSGMKFGINRHFTVWQKGRNSYKLGTGGPDRWGLGVADASQPRELYVSPASETAGGIFIRWTGTGWYLLSTNLEAPEYTFGGKQVVISVYTNYPQLITNVFFECGALPLLVTTQLLRGPQTANRVDFQGVVQPGDASDPFSWVTRLNVAFQGTDISNMVVQAVDMAYGTEATLLDAPDMGLELLRCQRYYLPIADTQTIHAPVSGGLYVDIPTPIEMYNTPTLIVSETDPFKIADDTGAWFPLERTSTDKFPNFVRIHFAFTAGAAFTAGRSYIGTGFVALDTYN